MSAKTFIDSISQYLLWDMDKSLLDADKHSSQIIQHVLELGTLDDWRLTRDYYGMDRIVSDCKKLRSLDPKALAFVCAMSDTNKEDYRCYHFKVMYPKFIITTDGVLRFGRVYLHKHLLYPDDIDCLGGGFWEVDPQRSIVILHGRSSDFGGPDFSGGVRRVEWGPELMPMPVFYAPNYPDLDPLEIVWVV